MEIPQNVQDKLKCSECDELLSCGPVYFLHETGGAICGRCSQQSEDSTENSDRTRNEQYEATASLLAFPCAFAARGCPEKQPFSLGQSSHELNCDFRPFICPIASRGTCDWISSWPTFKEHCNEKHPQSILGNPSNLPRPDLTTTNLQTYLISAFRFLFLLHIKVCVTSGKLFYSVRMLGDSKLLDTFSYSLKIEGNSLKIEKEGSVLRAGILMLQEPTANCISINCLLELLGAKYNESIFTITIQTLFRNCSNCFKNIDYDSEFCEECQGKLIKCKFNEKGCLFVDVTSLKCRKHAEYFCEYQTKCLFCKVNFVGGSLIGHLGSSCRKTIQSNIDSVVRVILGSKPKYILFSSNIGTITCEYYSSNFKLYFCLSTSLPWYELKNYKCLIELTDPQTKHTQHLTPQILYNDWYDWLIEENIYNFPNSGLLGIHFRIHLEKI